MRIPSNPWVSGAVVAACIVVFYVANTRNAFGTLINRFYPCTDAPGVSMPCYGKYDIMVMVLAAIVGLVFSVILVRDLLWTPSTK
jgi:hypothetical protein